MKQGKLIDVQITKGDLIPYKDICKESITHHEFPPVDFGNDYSLKVRIKSFVLLDRKGDEYDKGPCVSLQLFHGRRFLKALSIPSGKEAEVLNVIEQAYRFIANIKEL